ncbi:FAD-binding oxidoreductase [Aminobacter sp. BE322]|uniref:FAD-binding oxidoreductase n=1 Tax=unclassified Aminobacter TaxID=2644704 RepID=UPI003D25553C
MAIHRRRRGISRRLLLGAVAMGGAVYWTGTALTRLARAPTGPKSLGRIADVDGMALAAKPLDAAPDFDPALKWLAKGGEVNDASALSATPVYGVVEVTSEADVAQALAFARDNGLKVSMAGVRHSMGGHAFDDNALVLDMRKFNKVSVNDILKTITVEPGATWHDIQNLLHPRFAVKAMQSTDIFTVGGSISVNAHGMDHQAGSVAGSIRSLRVMLASGEVVTASRAMNEDLFRHVVGGYGLFGVVVSAVLEVVDNAVYRTSREIIRAERFPRMFERQMEPDKGLGLFYGHLSTSPLNFLEDMIVYRYDQAADAAPASQPALGEPEGVETKRLVMNLAKQGGLFQWAKWLAEKYLEPRAETCTVARTAAMGEGEACLVTRNNPMHDSVPYLFNDLQDETDILHEYFVPRGEFNLFLAAARRIIAAQPLALLNASVRVVHGEDVALPYATEPAFALVLYVNQSADEAGNQAMRALTRAMIDLTLRHRGRFFLPYQLHYTGRQLLASYPELPDFLARKRSYDPDELFTSTFYRAIKAMAAVD